MCRRCRLVAWGRKNKRYFFSDALTDDLRAAYQGNNPHLSRALDKLVARTKWPRWVFRREAIRLGIQGTRERRWTAAEDAYLTEGAGVTSVAEMARHLGRTVRSAQQRAQKMELSTRCQEGYTVADLAAALGVRRSRVQGWVARGLFGRVRAWAGTRVDERTVERFIRQYPHEYDLRRVDETWFKAVVFGTLRQRATPCRTNNEED